MIKQEIIRQLETNHNEFIDLLLSLNENDFLLSVNNKWSAGQQFKHICLSVSPLALGLRLPVIFLRIFFGKANRLSKAYDELVAKYHDKLQKGGVASGRFVPKPIAFEQRKDLERKLSGSVKQLCKNVGGFTEAQLDTYILPHPLLGKLTVREMLYFTIYHVEHHKKLILQSLARPA